MKTSSTNSYSPNFQASIRLTPLVRNTVLSMSDKHRERFFRARQLLSDIEPHDELILSRRKLPDGRNVPVLTNAETGAMYAELDCTKGKFKPALVNMLEKIVNKSDEKANEIFSRDSVVISKNREEILNKTIAKGNFQTGKELQSVDISPEMQVVMKKIDKIFPNDDISYKLSEEEKLFIKLEDDGFLYYLTDKNNLPNGKYFTVTYNGSNYRLNYEENIMPDEKIQKIFTRYTKKALEKLSNIN